MTRFSGIFQHEFRHLLGTLYLDHANKTLSLEQLGDEIDAGREESWVKNDTSNSINHLLADYNIGDTIEQYSAHGA